MLTPRPPRGLRASFVFGEGDSPRRRREASISSDHSPSSVRAGTSPSAVRSTSPSRTGLFKEHQYAGNLPILGLDEVEAVGASSRLPPIDLGLPRIRTPQAGLSRGVSSGFIAQANKSAMTYLKILDSDRIDRLESSQDDAMAGRRARKRGTHTHIAADLARAGLASLLGTNEDHANEFDDSYAGLAKLLNQRSDPPDSGGTGMWTEQDFGRIKIERAKPVEASKASLAKPKGRSKTQEYEMKSPRISLVERAAMNQHPVERKVVQREIKEKMEMLRSSPRELESFDAHVAGILRERNRRSREGPDFTIINTTPDALAKCSPRTLETRLAERSASLSARMSAAQAKAQEFAERKQAEHEDMLLRHERMVAKVEAQRAHAVLVHRQSAWFVLLALAARSRAIEVRVEPERRWRLEDKVARRLQKAFRRKVLWRRVQGLAASRRALTKLVWVLRLKMARRRKKTAANRILAFLREVGKQNPLAHHIRAFSYRVATAQRIWRKRAEVNAAQIELLTLQTQRVEERQILEDLAFSPSPGGSPRASRSPSPSPGGGGGGAPAASSTFLTEGGEGGAGDAEGAVEVVEHAVSMVMPLPDDVIRTPEESIRTAVSAFLERRRRERAAVLFEYRQALASYLEYEAFNRIFRDGHALIPVEMGGGGVVVSLDGFEATRVLWRVTNLQRRWRKLHPPKKVAGGGGISKIASLSGPSDDRRSMVERSNLLQREAGGKPDAPWLPILMTSDEVSDVLFQANKLAKS